MMETEELKEGYENIALPRTLAHGLNILVRVENEFTYEQLFQKIIDDFKVAYDVLPAEQKDGGRSYTAGYRLD